MPDVIQKCLMFLRSEAVFLILSNLTGLRLHRLAPRPGESDSEHSSIADLEATTNFDATATEKSETAEVGSADGGEESEGSEHVMTKRQKLSSSAAEGAMAQTESQSCKNGMEGDGENGSSPSVFIAVG